MQFRLFVFIIGFVPAYLNKEREFTQIIPLETQNNQSQIQVQEIVNNNQNNNCPDNNILRQTLYILKENLAQNENQTLNLEKFNNILNTAIKYLDTATDEKDAQNHMQDLNNILGNLPQRSKKEVLRNSPQFMNTAEKLTLQYKLPTTKNSDCHTLLKAIVNAINGARFQINKFCETSGKCVVHGENISTLFSSPITMPSYLFSHSENLPSPNQNLKESNTGHLGPYPQNRDTAFIQNYRPNVASLVKENFIPNSDEIDLNTGLLNADVIAYLQNNLPNTATLLHGNKFPDTTKEFPISLNRGDVNTILQSVHPNHRNVIIDKSLPTQQGLQMKNLNYESLNSLPQNLEYNPFATNVIKNNNMLKNLNNSLWKNSTRDHGPFMDVFTLLNDPTGYLSSINSHNDKFNFMPDKSATGSNIGEPFPLLEKNQNFFGNFTDFVDNIPEKINKIPVNGNVQNFPSNIYMKNRNLNIPKVQSTMNVPKFINTEPNYTSMPTYQNIQSPLTNYLNGKIFANSPNNIQEGKDIQESPYNPYYNPIDRQYFTWNPNHKITHEQPFQKSEMTNMVPNYNEMFRVPDIQGNILPNSDQQILKGTPISEFKSHENLNNANDLSDLYRLTSMTNSPKLNMAHNKNGIVELTFTLQHPQPFVYKPLCYVKYRLPYQTYMYNVQNLLKSKPFIRTTPAKLYGELLAVADISESSQDLKDLAKEDISKLVAANGALVKAKVLDNSGVSNAFIEDEIKNLLRLTSNLSTEKMINATNKVINNVEIEVDNITSAPATAVHKLSPSDLSVKSVNTRSLRYSLYPGLSTSQYVSSPNINSYNIGMMPYYVNRQIMFPQRHTG